MYSNEERSHICNDHKKFSLLCRVRENRRVFIYLTGCVCVRDGNEGRYHLDVTAPSKLLIQ
jgi:hypothetical protein